MLAQALFSELRLAELFALHGQLLVQLSFDFRCFLWAKALGKEFDDQVDLLLELKLRGILIH